MDEIFGLIWLFEIIVDMIGVINVIFKIIGYERSWVLVCFVVKVDGIKLKLMIVFKGVKCEVVVFC